MTDFMKILEAYENCSGLLSFATGVYIWELTRSLPFDLTLLRMHSRPGSVYARSMYLACRYLTLLSVVVYTVVLNLPTEFPWLHCKARAGISQTVSLCAITTASTLIAIRVIALWNRSVIIVGLCVLVLTVELGLSAYESAQVIMGLSPDCDLTILEDNQAIATITFTVNVSLLIIMLMGLLKLRDARRSPGIWRFLWFQGLVWSVLAICIEVPRMVFVWSNLIFPVNMMIYTLEVVALSIGATRMYRALWTYDQSAYNISTLTTFKAARPAPSRGHSDGWAASGAR